MFEIESSKDSRKQKLYAALFRSIEREFGYSARTLEEQIEIFFKKVHPVDFVIAFRQDQAEELLRDVSPELRSYLLQTMKKAEKRAKEEFQENH